MGLFLVSVIFIVAIVLMVGCFCLLFWAVEREFSKGLREAEHNPRVGDREVELNKK